MCGHIRSILIILLAHCAVFCSGFISETKDLVPGLVKGGDEKPIAGTIKLPSYGRNVFLGEGRSDGQSLFQEQTAQFGPQYQCGDRAFTVIIKQDDSPNIMIKEATGNLLYLVQLSPACGYSMKTTRKDVLLLFNYNSCYVKKEDVAYWLLINWYGTDRVLYCPVKKPAPTVLCKNDAMELTIGDGAMEDMSVSLNGQPAPLLYASSKCWQRMESNPGEVMFLIPYSACGVVHKDGQAVLDLKSNEESIALSCPSKQIYPSTESRPSGTFNLLHKPGSYREVPSAFPSRDLPGRYPLDPMDGVSKVSFSQPKPRGLSRPQSFPGVFNMSVNIPFAIPAPINTAFSEPYFGGRDVVPGNMNPLSGGAVQLYGRIDPFSGATMQLSDGTNSLSRGSLQQSEDTATLSGGTWQQSRGRDYLSKFGHLLYEGRDQSGVRDGLSESRYRPSGLRDSLFAGHDHFSRDGDGFFGGHDRTSRVRDGLLEHRDHLSGFRGHQFESRDRLSGDGDYFLEGRNPSSGDWDPMPGGRDRLLGERQSFLEGRDQLYGKYALEGRDRLSGDREYWLENRNRLSGNRGRWVDNRDYLSGAVARQLEDQDRLSEDEEHLLETSDLSEDIGRLAGSVERTSGARDRQDLFEVQDRLSGSSKRWFGDRSSLSGSSRRMSGSASSMSEGDYLSKSRTGSNMLDQKLAWISQLLPPGYVISPSTSQSPRSLPQTGQRPEPTGFKHKDLKPDPSEPDTDSDTEEILTPRSMNLGHSTKNMPSEHSHPHIYHVPGHPVKGSNLPHSQRSSVWLRVTPQGSP